MTIPTVQNLAKTNFFIKVIRNGRPERVHYKQYCTNVQLYIVQRIIKF
jgi:hypothetical protein